jgi:hypothetical protein
MFHRKHIIQKPPIIRHTTRDALFVVCFLFLYINQAYTQDRDSLSLLQSKTIRVKASSATAVNPMELKRPEKYFNFFEIFSMNSSITRELSRMLVKQDTKEENTNGRTYPSDKEFEQYRNYTIRNIEFRRINVFGPTVNDTTKAAYGWIEKTGNNLHIKTRESVLQNQLLVKKGDLVVPFVLADNERIIREQPYIEDVKIRIRPVPHTDSVDLVYYVKDLWTVGFDLFFKNAHAGKIQLYDKNILGTARQLESTVYFDANKTPNVGYEASYLNSNIGHNFITSKLNYVNVFNEITYNANLSRKFFTQSLHYAGGIDLQKSRNKVIIKELSPTFLFPVDYRRGFTWFGRSFTISSDIKGSPQSFVMAASILNEHFSKRPPVSPNFYQEYHNKTQLLSTFALNKQNFYKTSLLNSFGKTEDIPYGYLHKLTLGYEKSEFNNRLYGELSVAHGSFVGKLGYLYGSVSIGGFYHQHFFDQSVLRFKISTFSNLLTVNRFKMRYLFTVNYENGFNRFSDEVLTINDDFGIRGYNDDYFTGQQRLTANAEHVVFTPWAIANFKIAAFSFADFAWLTRTGTDILKSPMFSGFGVGVRIRNEHLVLNTIQIRLAYYPRLSDNAEVTYFLLSSTDRVTPDNFFVQPPYIPAFK